MSSVLISSHSVGEILAAVASETARKFVLFGGVHLLILFITIALPLGLSLWTRRSDRPELARWLAWILATVLIGDRLFALALGFSQGRITYWADALPMHLCDWATFAVVIALLWRNQQVYELAYFWGLSGTAQAILTPDLTENFPSPFFLSFFVSHCGIVVGVLFMTWGLGKRPGPGSVWRAILWNQAYLVSAGLVDWLFKVNFGYLAAKPRNPSLLDYFGPWPWYILVLEAAAVVFYLIFYAPFWINNRRRGGPLPPAAAPIAAVRRE
jgi:hypothetical integral membrane protein (TIGR02206 family)